MVQITSWKGRETERLKRQRNLKGGYTRYYNRKTKQGLQVVKNRKYYNDVYSPDGKFLGRELKYKNLATQDHVSKEIFKKQIRPHIPPKLIKQEIR